MVLAGQRVTEEEQAGYGVRWTVEQLPAPYFWPGPGGGLFLITHGGMSIPADSGRYPDRKTARSALERLLARVPQEE